MVDKKREKTKKKCKGCGAFIEEKFEYCSGCNKKLNNEIAIINKYNGDLNRTIDFYKLLVIEKFIDHDKIILSFLEKYTHIANRVIYETRHIGYLQEKRFIKKIKTSNPPFMKLEYYKAPLILIPAVRALKKDRRMDD